MAAPGRERSRFVGCGKDKIGRELCIHYVDGPVVGKASRQARWWWWWYEAYTNHLSSSNRKDGLNAGSGGTVEAGNVSEGTFLMICQRLIGKVGRWREYDCVDVYFLLILLLPNIRFSRHRDSYFDYSWTFLFTYFRDTADIRLNNNWQLKLEKTL